MGFEQSFRQFDGRSSQRFSTCWRLQPADWPQVYWTENKFWCLSNRRLAVFRLYQQFCPEDGALIPVEAGVDCHVERLEWRGSGGAKEALESLEVPNHMIQLHTFILNAFCGIYIYISYSYTMISVFHV